MTSVVLAMIAAASVASAANVTPFSQARPGATLPAGWAPLAFASVARATRYDIVAEGAMSVVAATAEGSASGWTFAIDPPSSEARVLRWRWKGERLPERGDTRTRAFDDAVARVYVMFRRWPLEVPRSLVYVWDTRAPSGSVFVNPYTDRVRNVVVESGPARVGQWLDYRRDVVADYRAAFGDDPPPIAGVAIMTDADNTNGRAAATYGDITLAPR